VKNETRGGGIFVGFLYLRFGHGKENAIEVLTDINQASYLSITTAVVRDLGVDVGQEIDIPVASLALSLINAFHCRKQLNIIGNRLISQLSYAQRKL
jgi:hypothetical protein